MEGQEYIEFPGGLKCDGLVVMDFLTLADRDNLINAPEYLSVLQPDTLECAFLSFGISRRADIADSRDPVADVSGFKRIMVQRATFVETPATQEVYFRQFTFMNRKEGVSPIQYKAHWSEKHAQLALNVPFFQQYVANYQQVRPPLRLAPAFVLISLTFRSLIIVLPTRR